MHDLGGMQNAQSCHWSDEFQKISIFFGKACSRIFGAPGCHPSTLIDIANTALASKRSVKPICKTSEGYRTHRGVTGPMKFKKKKTGLFFGKSCSRKFGAPGCHPSTLIDLANTALASKGSVKTKCLITEGYRTHRGVAGPKNFKKSGRFIRKIVLPGFGAPGCNLDPLIELANTALTSKCSVAPICIISEGYRTHGDVTGPMKFKKKDVFFSENRAPGILVPLLAIQAP